MFIDSPGALAGRQKAVKGRLSACRSRMAMLQRYVDRLEAVEEPTPQQVGQAYRLTELLGRATTEMAVDPLFTESGQEGAGGS